MSNSITKEELRTALYKHGLSDYGVNDVLDGAFPPPEPKSLFRVRYSTGELGYYTYDSYQEAISARDSHTDVIVEFKEVIK